MAFYTKALYAGIGTMVVYDGTNIDAVATALASISSTDMRVKDGELYVFGELIRKGDAVCLDDTSPTALPHAKISRETLDADEYRIETIEYSGNIDEVAAFAAGKVEFTGDALYVNGVLVNDTDHVYKVRGAVKGKATATRIGDDYTIES